MSIRLDTLLQQRSHFDKRRTGLLRGVHHRRRIGFKGLMHNLC